jgi:DNA-directed RNA polymerase specialized sigma24 family protein
MNQIDTFSVRDEESFVTTFNLYSPALLGIINGITHDQVASESILEEMFVKLWEQQNLQHEGYQRLFSWLSIVAREAALEHLNNSPQRSATAENSDSKIPKLLDLIYYQGLSQAGAAEKLNLTLAQARSELRSCVLATRDNHGQ